MGCFDYECDCNGNTCIFTGGQDGGSATVIIEVPLNDGTTVYAKGDYNSYGEVHVGEYVFYAEQFKAFFKDWLKRQTESARSKIFLAKRIWTVSYLHREYDEDGKKSSTKEHTYCCPLKVVPMTTIRDDIAKKCIRADEGLNILSDDAKKQQRINQLKLQIEVAQKELQALLA